MASHGLRAAACVSQRHHAPLPLSAFYSSEGSRLLDICLFIRVSKNAEEED